jgi:hypothetical protein
MTFLTSVLVTFLTFPFLSYAVDAGETKIIKNWLVGIPGCGHNMVFEQPEILSRLIIEYVSLIAARSEPPNETTR